MPYTFLTSSELYSVWCVSDGLGSRSLRYWYYTFRIDINAKWSGERILANDEAKKDYFSKKVESASAHVSEMQHLTLLLEKDEWLTTDFSPVVLQLIERSGLSYCDLIGSKMSVPQRLLSDMKGR